jgi:nucleoid-associated protein YgaU
MKLKITGVSDPSATGGSTFECDFSPENVKHNRAVDVQEKKVGDTAGPVTQFQSYGSESLDFELVFDGTNYNRAPVDVDARVDALTEIVYNYQGDIHKPYYLLVEWSHFVYRGQLKAYDVDFTLFDIDGKPLRAKVKLSITVHKDPSNRGASRSSPDMTHVKTVRVGDSLPLMCKEIYGKMEYYLQVAEHNGLTNFRELEIGENLEFPPLER